MSRITILILGIALLAAGCGSDSGKMDSGFDKEVLMNPNSEELKQQAPDEYKVLFETTAGDFTLEVKRAKAPRGADRFYNLVTHGFYDEQRFFRVVPGFVVQWGMHGDPEVSAQWNSAHIMDDPVNASNVRGTICFAATQMPNSRTTQVFLNLGDNTNLDAMRFAPFGEVIDGMEVVDAINDEYGEQPSQQQIGMRGNEYLQEKFPKLDYIKTARIVD